MAENLKIGDRVRVRGAEPVGVVTALAGLVQVTYPHDGRSSLGLYPAGHLEVLPPLAVAAETPPDQAGGSKETSKDSPAKPSTKLKA